MKKTKNFASRWGFILASVGYAVGMANVWGFPNKLGSNGGGAFLLIYLLFVFIFSYVGLPAEFAMGRPHIPARWAHMRAHGQRAARPPVRSAAYSAGFRWQAHYASPSATPSLLPTYSMRSSTHSLERS